MSPSKIFGYLFVVVAAVCLDVALLRLKQRRWRLDRVRGLTRRLVVGVDGVFGPTLQRLNRRLAGLKWARLARAGLTGFGTAPRVTLIETGGAPTPSLPDPVSSWPHVLNAPSADPPLPAAADSAGSPAVELPPSLFTTSSGVLSVQVSSATTDGPGSASAHVNISVELPVGATVRVTIEAPAGQEPVVTVSSSGQPASSAARRAAAGRHRVAGLWQAAMARVGGLSQGLFFGVLALYGVTHLIGLDRFPIYFFTDEAVQTLQAASFVTHGFHDQFGTLFPTYFKNGVYFNLSLSVYAQVLPYLLFGKAIWVTRGVSALLSLMAPVAVSLTLKNIFQMRWWWLGGLLLAITPAWFLHSRTAFEAVIMVALYAGFLYVYLLYRYRSPRYLFPTLLFGALAFYSYTGGQFTVIVTCLVLLIIDFRYHWQNRRTGWKGLAFLGLLMLPYLRFTLEHPEEAANHLRVLDSYWLHNDLTLLEKLSKFFHEYAFGLSPQYWFLPDNHRDLARHIMKGYGHISPLTLPFLLVGLFVCVRKIRQPAYQVLLIALLLAPVSGAITSVALTRVWVFVVPAALLTAIGLETLWTWLPWRRWTTLAAVGVFAAASAFGLGMLREALVNGPVRYSDYGLGGMQWGARQLFGEQIPAWLARDPQMALYVSPTWANGTELFPQYFLTDQQQKRVQLQGVAYYLAEKHDLPPDLLVVLPPEEYAQLNSSPKVNIQKVEQVLPYPDGQPGFYFLRLNYSGQADAIFAAEHARMLVPVVETYHLDGQDVIITHPRFGLGQLHDMLDGDPYTLVNAPGFNPFVLDFDFPTPRSIRGLTLITGSMPDFTVAVTLDAGGNSPPQVYAQHFAGLPPDPTVTIKFDQGPARVMRLHLEIQDNANTGPGVNIHVREVQFQ